MGVSRLVFFSLLVFLQETPSAILCLCFDRRLFYTLFYSLHPRTNLPCPTLPLSFIFSEFFSCQKSSKGLFYMDIFICETKKGPSFDQLPHMNIFIWWDIYNCIRHAMRKAIFWFRFCGELSTVPLHTGHASHQTNPPVVHLTTSSPSACECPNIFIPFISFIFLSISK